MMVWQKYCERIRSHGAVKYYVNKPLKLEFKYTIKSNTYY